MILTDQQIDAFCSKQAGPINRDRDRRKRETHRALLQAIRIDRELDKAMVAFEQEIAEWAAKNSPQRPENKPCSDQTDYVRQSESGMV